VATGWRRPKWPSTLRRADVLPRRCGLAAARSFVAAATGSPSARLAGRIEGAAPARAGLRQPVGWLSGNTHAKPQETTHQAGVAPETENSGQRALTVKALCTREVHQISSVSQMLHGYAGKRVRFSGQLRADALVSALRRTGIEPGPRTPDGVEACTRRWPHAQRSDASKRNPGHRPGLKTAFRCHGRRLLREEQQGAEAHGQCSLLSMALV
jgi:hypothetical protein